MPNLQYLPTLAATFATFINTSTPPVPLFSDLVCLALPSDQRPTSRLTSGAPSLWPVILSPHRAQTITLEANSSLFPSSAALSLIFNKKRFSFLNQKKRCLEPLSCVLSFLHLLILSMALFGVGLQRIGKFYYCCISQRISPSDLMWVSFETHN